MNVRPLISAQVMTSRFVGSSPTSGSLLTAWSLLGILSLPFSKNKLKKTKTNTKPVMIGLFLRAVRGSMNDYIKVLKASLLPWRWGYPSFLSVRPSFSWAHPAFHTSPSTSALGCQPDRRPGAARGSGLTSRLPQCPPGTHPLLSGGHLCFQPAGLSSAGTQRLYTTDTPPPGVPDFRGFL